METVRLKKVAQKYDIPLNFIRNAIIRKEIIPIVIGRCRELDEREIKILIHLYQTEPRKQSNKIKVPVVCPRCGADHFSNFEKGQGIPTVKLRIFCVECRKQIKIMGRIRD